MKNIPKRLDEQTKEIQFDWFQNVREDYPPTSTKTKEARRLAEYYYNVRHNRYNN